MKKTHPHIKNRLDKRLEPDERALFQSEFIDYLLDNCYYPRNMMIDEPIVYDMILKVAEKDANFAGMKTLEGIYNKPMIKSIAQALRNMTGARCNTTLSLMEAKLKGQQNDESVPPEPVQIQEKPAMETRKKRQKVQEDDSPQASQAEMNQIETNPPQILHQ